MRFNVKGLDRDTAEPLDLVVEAEDFRAAEEKAHSRGIVVERVLPADRGVSTAPPPMPRAGKEVAEKPKKKSRGDRIADTIANRIADTIAVVSFLGLVGVVIFFGYEWLTYEPKPPDPAEQARAARAEHREHARRTQEARQHDAAYAAQGIVSNFLRSPSSASFQPVRTYDISPSGDGYIVRGQVDAVNAFNAPVRELFVVELRPDGDEWRADFVMIGGEPVYTAPDE